MLFAEKADYAGPHDTAGIPQLNYRGKIGLQYNPIAIAQWGLGNYNLFCQGHGDERNTFGFWMCNHKFDWEYRSTLKAPWYSGLAQGQGISLLLRAYRATGTGA